MPFNGAGMFVRLRNWVEDATAGIKIRADYHDIEDDNFADGLSRCIARDGQSTVVNNIPMNGKRLVALADPVDAQDAATKAYADTKLPLAGGTITGQLTVTGKITSQTGYATRPGTAGPGGSSVFNFDWVSSNVEAWIDATRVGIMATQDYVETRAQYWPHNVADPKINRAGDTMTGTLNTRVSGNIGTAGPLNSIVVYGNASDWAAISFLSNGVFGGNFGMHPNGDFYCGGWSYGSGQAYVFWTARNLNPIKDGRLVHVGSPSLPVNGQIYEPYAGSVITGLARDPGTPGFPVTAARWRQLQLLTPGGWYAVGYA